VLRLKPFTAPLWVVYLTAAALFLAATFMIPRSAAFPPGAMFGDGAGATLELIKELIKLAVTLDSALLTAAAAFAVKGRDWAPRWSRLDSSLVLLVFVAGVASYFGVYFCYIRLLTMLTMSTIYPLERGVVWSIRLMYYGILLGVFILGLILSRVLDRRDL
jgi:hypothetical protein